MALITTIAEVQKYLRVRYVNSNTSLPDFGIAEDRYLIPLLGNILWTAISTNTHGSIAQDLFTALVDKVKRADTCLAYWIELPLLHTQIGETGIVVVESQNLQAAHRWEFEKLHNSLEEKACSALEVLISFLFANATALSWQAPERVKTVIKSATDFDQLFKLYQPYRVFQQMRPIMADVEASIIAESIGEETLVYLRDYTSSDAIVLKAISLLKKAIVYLTVRDSVSLLPVRYGAEGLTVALGTNTDGPEQGQQRAEESPIGRLLAITDEKGRSYLVSLITFLNAKATTQLFATYRASSYYTSPTAAATTNPNTNREGVFGL